MTEWNNCWIIYPSINQIHLTTRSDNQIVNIFRYFCLGHLIQHAKGLKYNLKICHSNSKCSVYLQFFFFLLPFLRCILKENWQCTQKGKKKKKASGWMMFMLYVVSDSGENEKEAHMLLIVWKNKMSFMTNKYIAVFHDSFHLYSSSRWQMAYDERKTIEEGSQKTRNKQ